jgi:hypothetical protein
MGSEFIKSHGDNINFSSPEGEGFPPSPKETLITHYQCPQGKHRKKIPFDKL